MQISLDRKRLDITFIICFAFLLAMPSLLPQQRIIFFAPFLIVACYKRPLSMCLWLSFFCGLLIDLLGTHGYLGFYSLAYCLAIILLYPQRRNFYADNASTLPIMVFFFSILTTLIMALILYSIELKNIFSLNWALTDIILMPALDACYAFIIFIAPGLLFGKKRLSGKDYFK